MTAAALPLHIFVQDLRSSGVVRNAISYASGLRGRFATTLVAGSGEGLWREEAARAVPLVVLGTAPGRMAKLVTAWRLRRWLLERGSATLLSMGNFGHPTVFLAACGLPRVKRIYRISNELVLGKRGDWLRRRYLHALVRDAAGIALVGQRIGSQEMFGPALRSGRATIMSNGVDLVRARSLAAAPAPHPWLEDDVPIVMTVGRLRHQKNQALLVRAVGVARGVQRLRLIVLGGSGSPDAPAGLHAIAADGGWSDDLLLPGETDNVFAWLARADVFALPSRHEGSSMALLEAMAVGTPVIAARSAGDAEAVLENGRHGLLVEGNNAEDMARAILRQVSRERVLPGDCIADHSLPAVIERYGDFIERVGLQQS